MKPELKVGSKMCASSSYELHYGEVTTLTDTLLVITDLYNGKHKFQVENTLVDLRDYKNSSAETRWRQCEEKHYQKAKKELKNRFKRDSMKQGAMVQLDKNGKVITMTLLKENRDGRV